MRSDETLVLTTPPRERRKAMEPYDIKRKDGKETEEVFQSFSEIWKSSFGDDEMWRRKAPAKKVKASITLSSSSDLGDRKLTPKELASLRAATKKQSSTTTGRGVVATSRNEGWKKDSTTRSFSSSVSFPNFARGSRSDWQAGGDLTNAKATAASVPKANKKKAVAAAASSSKKSSKKDSNGSSSSPTNI